MSGGDFHSVVYQLLVVEKLSTVKEVAAEMGLKEQSLYSRINGRVRFSVDDARNVLRLVPDSRLADYVLDGSAFTAVKREVSEPGEKAESVRAQAVQTLLNMADVLREIEVSVADDGKIDHLERQEIEGRVVEAARALAALQHALQLV